jgi:hypothetical protein
VANRAKIDNQTTIVQTDPFTMMRDIASTLHLNRISRLPRASFRLQIAHAKFYSRSDDAVIRVYDAAGNVIETHEHVGDFREF